MGSDDQEAREARARDIRDRIEKLSRGESDGSKPTPRELTDEAAREAAARAKDKKGKP